jgi:hypothetical protein
VNRFRKKKVTNSREGEREKRDRKRERKRDGSRVRDLDPLLESSAKERERSRE